MVVVEDSLEVLSLGFSWLPLSRCWLRGLLYPSVGICVSFDVRAGWWFYRVVHGGQPGRGLGSVGGA